MPLIELMEMYAYQLEYVKLQQKSYETTYSIKIDQDIYDVIVSIVDEIRQRSQIIDCYVNVINANSNYNQAQLEHCTFESNEDRASFTNLRIGYTNHLRYNHTPNPLPQTVFDYALTLSIVRK